MALQDEAEQLAQELFETRSQLRAAGRALHDEVGPLLSAAGIRLGLLTADHPQASREAGQVLIALEEAMERVRSLSRQLNPPPAAHLGLKKALANVIEAQAESFDGLMRFSYTATVPVPDDPAAVLYQTACALLAQAAADPSAQHLSISVSDLRQGLIIKIASDGRKAWPRALMAALERRAKPAKIVLAATTKRGTIASIRYAARRPARG